MSLCENYSQGVVDALIESNDILQTEVTRLRETNATLRRVNSAVRRANDIMRTALASAAENDEMFKSYCAGELDAPVASLPEGGLPEGEDGGTTQSTV